jgi:hypothetical protein
MELDTGGASSIDLHTINGGTIGDILIIKSSDGSRDIVIKHLTGNIDITTDGDITLDSDRDRIILQFDGSLWIVIAREIFQDFRSSKAANGYGYLPNGILQQQGITASIATGASLAITFPRAFSTACRSVVVTRIEASTTASDSYSVGTASTTGFTLYSNNARAGAYYWQATGD